MIINIKCSEIWLKPINTRLTFMLLSLTNYIYYFRVLPVFSMVATLLISVFKLKIVAVRQLNQRGYTVDGQVFILYFPNKAREGLLQVSLHHWHRFLTKRKLPLLSQSTANTADRRRLTIICLCFCYTECDNLPFLCDYATVKYWESNSPWACLLTVCSLNAFQCCITGA